MIYPVGDGTLTIQACIFQGNTAQKVGVFLFSRESSLNRLYASCPAVGHPPCRGAEPLLQVAMEAQSQSPSRALSLRATRQTTM